MTLDPTAPGMASADPQGNPQVDPPDSAQDSRQPQSTDWEARTRAAQADLTRRAQENADLRRQLAELQQEPQQQPEGQQPAAQRGPTRAQQEAEEYQQRWLESEWARAEAIHGPEVLDAYGEAAQLFDQATGPIDFVTAFETYHQLRSRGATPQQAAEGSQAPSRQQAVQPRVDPNLGAPPANDQLERTLQEAKAQGPAGLGRFVGASLERMGLGQG